MAGVKKAITYKTGYKTLKNMINAKLAKERQFSTKKERKEAVKGVIGETSAAFDKGISDYLNASIESGMHTFFLKNKDKERANVKEQKKVKPNDSAKSSIELAIST